MSCPTPFETLCRYWLDDLPAAEVDALEEHLFACDACADACERLGELAVALRGWIPPIISHARRDRLLGEGKRIRATPVQSGVTAHARFDPELDLLVHVLKADLASAVRVDVDIAPPAGGWRATVEHVPFDPDTGEVLVACQPHFRHIFPGDPVFTVFVVEDGERRQVGTYFVEHEFP
jgi:anti-sigma factor RsiW